MTDLVYYSDEDGCKYLRERMQVLAGTDAVTCNAPEMGKSDTEIANPILDKRRGRKNESL